MNKQRLNKLKGLLEGEEFAYNELANILMRNNMENIFDFGNLEDIIESGAIVVNANDIDDYSIIIEFESDRYFEDVLNITEVREF